MKRRAAVGLLVTALLAVTAHTATAATRKQQRPTEFSVGTTMLRFDDQGREIDVTVYYPATGRATPLEIDGARPAKKWGPYPLILFSHAFGATPNDYMSLLHAWATRGYVVAVPTYSKTDAQQNENGDTVVNLGDRVVDASFVIDRMLDRVQGGFGELVDRRRIVAAGHALGAVTTFALAYNTGARDPRIDAAVTLAGSLAGDDTTYFTDIDTPLLAIHGDADQTDPIAGTQQAFDLANPPKFYVTLLGGDHSTSFVNGTDPGFKVVENTTLDFFSAYLGHRTSGLEQLERDGKVKSLAKITSEPQ